MLWANLLVYQTQSSAVWGPAGPHTFINQWAFLENQLVKHGIAKVGIRDPRIFTKKLVSMWKVCYDPLFISGVNCP